MSVCVRLRYLSDYLLALALLSLCLKRFRAVHFIFNLLPFVFVFFLDFCCCYCFFLYFSARYDFSQLCYAHIFGAYLCLHTFSQLLRDLQLSFLFFFVAPQNCFCYLLFIALPSFLIFYYVLLFSIFFHSISCLLLCSFVFFKLCSFCIIN